MNVTDYSSSFGLKIEIRLVSKDWKHPKEAGAFFKPLLNREHLERVTELWYERVMWLVANGCYSDIEEGSDGESHYFPDESQYMPQFDHPTHFQAYSVSSGGVPISPVFDNLISVMNYLSRDIILSQSEQIWLMRNVKE